MGRDYKMYSDKYFKETIKIAEKIDKKIIEEIALQLKILRESSGRLFVLGVGGSAGNSSHAVNDFRKLCGIEAYAPTDNVSELSARTNDEGWSTVFSEWLKVSKPKKNDAIFVLSVGGGDLEKNVSPNLVSALRFAKEHGLKIFGIVGRDGGFTKKVGDYVVVVPTIDPDKVTPHAESFQGVVWHCLVSNPILQLLPTKW
jgi:D-sedoheptulose 7-phosphate isomerase